MSLVVLGHVVGWSLPVVLSTCCSCRVVRGYVVGHVFVLHAVVGVYIAGGGRKLTTQVGLARYLPS